MSVRLILGRAGSGKTQYCLQAMAEALHQAPAGDPLLLIVPEQMTFNAERALLAAVPGGVMVRAQVYSFRRLAHRVLQEKGGSARLPIGELGKRMILRHLLDSKKEELCLFDRSAERIGFTDALSTMLTELKAYRIDQPVLENCMDQLAHVPGTGLLRDKLHDLAVMAAAMQEALAGRYTDPDDYLDLLAERLQEWSVGQVWIDGFTRFMPQERRVIAALLRKGWDVHITLTMDGGKLQAAAADPFHGAVETYHRLLQIAVETGAQVLPPVILDKRDGAPRFAGAPELQHLERTYFAPSLTPWPSAAPAVAVAIAANRRAEVEGAAREIVRLCREEGYRWQEMAILTRDLAPYLDLLLTVFDDLQIPFFLDHQRSVIHHPLVELLRSACEIIESDWADEPIFRYLKTDLIPVTRDAADQLENYVLAHGLRGFRWRDSHDWGYRRRFTVDETAELGARELRDLAAVNTTRDQVRAPLLRFEQAIKGARDARTFSAALYQLLLDLDVPGQLALWSEQAEASGQVERARAYRQIWTAALDVLDQLVEALGDQPVDLAMYRTVLDAGLETLRLRLIPPELNQVLIGTLDRSRNPQAKVVFVLGVTEGGLPARLREDGVFDDRERELISQAAQIEMAPGHRRRLFDEQTHVYMALTRASARLILSYPMADEEGRAMAPSFVIHRVRQVVPALTSLDWPLSPPVGDEAAGRAFLCPPPKVIDYLIGQLREGRNGHDIAPYWWQVYSWLVVHPQWRPRLATMLPGLWHRNREHPLPGERTRHLIGSRLQASISRIESYLACPFRHFAAYGLRLRERSQYRLQAPEVGQFHHAALKRFGDQLQADQLDWGRLSREEQVRRVEQVMAHLAPQLQNEILLSSARYRYLQGRLRKTLLRVVQVLSEHGRSGRFQPIGLEIPFGLGDAWPPVLVPLSQGRQMELVGRIDRLDAFRAPLSAASLPLDTPPAPGELATWLRIIDYKSSKTAFDLGGVYHGLQLQLLTYLDVALQNMARAVQGTVLPAGMLYFGLKQPIVTADGPLPLSEVQQRQMKSMRMEGMVLHDLTIAGWMDEGLQPGNSSLLVPLGVKKDGDFTAASRKALLTLEQFAQLRNHSYRIFTEAGEAIFAGHIDISPYRRQQHVACTFCPYQPVCQFDPTLPDNDYRLLIDPPPDQIWQCLKDLKR
ncbi:helicase-exonuclease AddAB subunit AddB [Heliophilum fasciatum]|uniref:ATP-dependent helicase/deoxyribonuclease subunit B n=1 Tax=Heliophilum fasciatum TaxID=35700 RepID=A0A4R2SA60_9FIRM|nr:helicase-exonuclease AddAB subunit AddB [Heliophilum fasciatum]MCW2277261.1 ATP-dependent helicase/nuclease subunit B [Heliophilum fasciatum]TCP68105.1 DNA helicase/exodeoxyribonuclease V subunit B [Heliophilum fasciatum]